jgi:hypothetical protein
MEDRKSDNEFYTKLTTDLELLVNLKIEVNKKIRKDNTKVQIPTPQPEPKPEDEPEEEGEQEESQSEPEDESQPVGYERIDLSRELSTRNMSILTINRDLLNRVMNAVDIYNKAVDEDADEKTKEEYLQNVNNLRLEFRAYKDAFIKEKGWGEDKVEKEKEKNRRKNETKQKNIKKEDEHEEIKPVIEEAPDEEITPATITTPETINTPTNPTHLKQSEIFIVEAGRDYGDIVKDKKFDKWLKDIYEIMVLRNEATESNSADIEYWYHYGYRPAVLYIERLNSIFDDINRNDDKTTKLMSELKIKDVLYQLYLDPRSTKPRIEAIIESYERTKEDEAKLADFNKIEILKTTISSRTEGQTLKPEDVKSVLESDPAKKIEHLSNLRKFLRDILSNYDFYNSDSKDESDPNNIYYTFRKWKAAKKTQPEKPIGFFSKIRARFIASLPQELNTDEFNNFELLIRELRKSNLVDRKNGAVNGNTNNKAKLNGIIDLIDEYIANPETIESTLDEEGKGKLKVVEGLYKNFSDIYYKSSEAKTEAQQKLDNNRIDTPISDTGPKSILDTLFETDREKHLFENEAKYRMSKESLKALEAEINNFPQARHPEKLKTIVDKFSEIKSIIEPLSDNDTDILELSKIGLRIKELIIKNLKKDDYEELSSAFPIYSEIINSTEIEKGKKVEYLTALMDSLRTHRTNPENTLLQNVTLDAIIEKYQGELTSIQ